ncbi:MAG TPA: SLC13 family permease, partial [Pseudorhizobium sp.]|nr:SLC13 family permease [Pseudorhizobium sp.]
MSTEQILAFTVIGVMMAVFIWDRFRYDIVACCALVAAVAVGIVPVEEAFSGFSDDIVIIVGSALVVSAAVARSGIVDIAIKKFFPNLNSVRAQLALLMIVVAVMSAFIKNIGALAIMMPVAFQFSRRSGVSPSKYLMPMAFSALLGGLMTQ